MVTIYLDLLMDQSLAFPCLMKISHNSCLLWKHQDQTLMSLLIASLFESIIAHVLEATTSSEVWNLLDEMFTATF